MPHDRRFVLIGACALAVVTGASASGQTAPRELVFAVVPSENSDGVTNRYSSFVAYIERETGIRTTLRIASDYAAVIEGQRAGNIHIGAYGPAAFAKALKIGAAVEAFGMQTNVDGSRGYYSVFLAKADGPIKSLDDARGKDLCLVDPNSASGNQVPRFALNKLGIVPESYFRKIVYTGSHENAVIGVQQGTCSLAANWWTNEVRSNLKRMASKGMVKESDFRIVFKSDLITGSPVAYLRTLPDDLKAKIRTAFFEIRERAPEVWNTLSSGGSALPWTPASNKEFDTMIELNDFVDSLRKKSGS